MKKLIIGAVALVVLAGLTLFVAVPMLLSPERVRAAVEAQASSAIGRPVKIGAAAVQVWPRPGVSITDMTVGEPAQLTLARAQLSTGLGALLSRRVEDAEITVEDSRLDLVALLGALGGLTGPPAKSQQPAAPPALTIVSVRSIGLRNVDLVVGDRHANVTLESRLFGDRLDINRLSAKTAETSLEATGAVISIIRQMVRLKIEADPLDLDGLMQFAGAFSKLPAAAPAAAGGGAPAALDLEAEVHAPRGRVAGLAFTDLRTTIVVTPAGVTLRPFTLSALAGRFDGVATVALSQAQPALAIDGKVSGVDLQQLATFASGEPSAITGTLNATMKLNGRGLDTDTAIKSANGSASVSLLKGRMPGLQLVRPAILAFGRPQGAPPEGNGEAFDAITANIAIGGGQLRTNDLTFASRDVDMSGAGSLAVTGGRLDLKANLMLSEELSAQAGRDLVRYTREGNRVVLPATVSGTVADPSVMIDTTQVLRRAVTNELQNRTKSALERLLPGALGRKKPPKQ